MSTRIPHLTPRRRLTLGQHRPTVNDLAQRQILDACWGWCRAFEVTVNRLALSLSVQESAWEAYYLLDMYYIGIIMSV